MSECQTNTLDSCFTACLVESTVLDEEKGTWRWGSLTFASSLEPSVREALGGASPPAAAELLPTHAFPATTSVACTISKRTLT